MIQKEYNSTSIITYNSKEIDVTKSKEIPNFSFEKNKKIHWINTYGFEQNDEIKNLIRNSTQDDFLLKLINDNDSINKLVSINGGFFLTIRVYRTEENDFEQMNFIIGDNFVWSIQEKLGDYFDEIRNRLENNIGLVRKKGVDYLLFLILEAIIDKFALSHQTFIKENQNLLNSLEIKPNPDFAVKIEKLRNQILRIKKATLAINDILTKLSAIQIDKFNSKYFSDLSNQTGSLIQDLDFEKDLIEGNLNLIFNFQSHRLNEIMKVLTVFSVIFIPLTFLAGIYGMNFENMPELKAENGYFYLLGVMLVVTLISLIVIKRKKWI
jgi:magnesium transporter